MSWMVSPQQFANEFNQIISRRAGEIQNTWYGNVRQYTNLLLNKDDGILNEVRQQLGLEHWGAEFMRLDAAYSNQTADGTHRLALVVEHENSIFTASWEVRKLAYIAAPLRVLITYPRSVSHGEKKLRHYCELIEAIGVFATGQLLVVFGSEDKSASEREVVWRYYLYAGSEFLSVYPKGSEPKP